MVAINQCVGRDDGTTRRPNSSQRENGVQYVTSGGVSAPPTPPHLPQTTSQSGWHSVPRSPASYCIKTYPLKKIKK